MLKDFHRYPILNSVAPIRVCDLGGWTDTWFAKHGQVLNISVQPFVEVQMRASEHEGGQPRFTIHVENYNEHIHINEPAGQYDKHPLLEAAFDLMKIPTHLALDITIHSDVPPGASTGTSAAVSIALIGALDQLTPGYMTAHEAARAAHRIETEFLGFQCGIQDQIASAYGGINFIDMTDYPNAMVSPVLIQPEVCWELDTRLILVYIGGSHSSTQVHERVIEGLEKAGPDAAALLPLRDTALRGKDALLSGDLKTFGQVMIDNTEGQRALHCELISAQHQKVIDIASKFDAYGWKVNGAGGAGGSVSILANPNRSNRRKMISAIAQVGEGVQVIPTHLSPTGLRVWRSEP